MIDETSLRRAINEAVTEVVPATDPVDDTTPLLGEGAVVDSVGFVTILVAIEQRLDGVDLAASFLEHGMADDGSNPFRTIGTLTRHLRALTSRDAP